MGICIIVASEVALRKCELFQTTGLFGGREIVEEKQLGIYLK